MENLGHFWVEINSEDGMTLEQLMAFTVSEDHARQEQVWQAIKDSWSKEPYTIRRMLTETTVRASDRRALFVGIPAYEAAGGSVLRDLFEGDDGGWLQDAALLDRLVAEKLKTEAEAIAAEGWAWVDAAVSFPYGHDHALRRITGTAIDLTEEERAMREALRDEYDRLEAEHAETEELPDDIDGRLGEIEAALEAFEDRPMVFSPEQRARAGVLVSLRSDGSLLVDRGRVRPEDEAVSEDEGWEGRESSDADGARPRAAGQPAVVTMGHDLASAEDSEEGDTLKPLPESLVTELTAFRTLALRDAVARHPHVALTALLHRLVLEGFGERTPGAALEAFVRTVHFPVQAPGLADSQPAQQIAARHAAWQADLPLAEDDDRLWSWIDSLDDPSRLALLAHCVSFGINALHERPNPYSGTGVSQAGLERRLREADRLAAYGRELSRPGDQAADPGGGARGRGRGRGPAHRSPEKARHGAGSRATPGGQRLAARAAAPAGRRSGRHPRRGRGGSILAGLSDR